MTTNSDDENPSSASSSPVHFEHHGDEEEEESEIKDVHSPNYQGEYTRFMNWLSERGIGPDEHGRWITQPNVHLYFRENLGRERTGNRNTLRRIASAIEWYAENCEYH